MQMFLLSVNAVLPILLVMLLGYFLKVTGLLNATFFSQSSKLVFRIALPILIFTKLSQGSALEKLSEEQIKMIVLVISGVLVTYILVKFFFFKTEKGNIAISGVMLQGSFRSNYLIIGYPILQSIYGDRIIVNFALLGLILIPMFNILSLLALNNTEKGTSLKTFEIMKSIVKNPLIIAVILGFIFKLMKLELPNMVNNTFDLIGSLATPLGLIAIGGFFEFKNLKKYRPQISKVTLLKLIILPILSTIIGYLIGLSIENIILVTVIFGGPTAVSSFAMASEMYGDTELASSIVIVTSLFCSFTLVILMTFWMNIMV